MSKIPIVLSWSLFLASGLRLAVLVLRSELREEPVSPRAALLGAGLLAGSALLIHSLRG